MQSKYIAGLLSVFTICATVVLAEEELDPAPVIEGRQSALRDIGAAFKGINDELKKARPALPLIRQYAKQIDDLARQQKFWFPRGTGPETEIDTQAKPAIWEQPERFAAGQVAMSEQAAKLVEVASRSDVAAIKTQWQSLGNACKHCHETFREEDD